MPRLSTLLLLASATTTACSTPTPDTAAKSAPPADTTIAARTPARATAPSTPGATISGTIREVIPVESYLYLRLDTPDGETWTAVNQAKLAVGDTVTVYNVLRMEQFASPTLKRTFPTIYFGSTEPVTPAPGGPAAPGASPSASAAAPAASSGTPTTVDARIGPIAPATGRGAHTVASVWRQKDGLVRTTVAVRGVVVKYNAGVMGKNWIHLQDGSGSASTGTHDLAATTLDATAVGDTVTVLGIVRTNVDVGAGYKYTLLLENARIVAP